MPEWVGDNAITHDFSKGPLIQTHDGQVLTRKGDGTLCTPDGKSYPPQEVECDSAYNSDDNAVVVTDEITHDDVRRHRRIQQSPQIHGHCAPPETAKRAPMPTLSG